MQREKFKKMEGDRRRMNCSFSFPSIRLSIGSRIDRALPADTLSSFFKASTTNEWLPLNAGSDTSLPFLNVEFSILNDHEP